MDDNPDSDKEASVIQCVLPKPERSVDLPRPHNKQSRFLDVDDSKAGMIGLNTEKINTIIHEHSKNSKFFKNQQRREEENRRRIERKLETLKNFTPFQIEQAEKSVDKFLFNLEKTRDLTRIFVHIDMDAFYAAVEMRDDPSLRDKPMAVGGDGMLSTSNYLARQFGVRAAMPGFIGRQLCPNLVIVPCNFEKYRIDSRKIMSIVNEYDSNFASASMDEAYADITEHLKMRLTFSDEQRTYPKEPDSSDEFICFGLNAEETVRELRHRIYLATRLTASAGIACNLRLAKLCSDINKPNGQFLLQSDVNVILNFIRILPVRKIKGIGKVTAMHLEAYGIETVANIYEKRGILKLLEYSTSFEFLMRVCCGYGSTVIEHDDIQKSVGHETTFTATDNTLKLIQLCRDLSKKVVDELLSDKIVCKRVTLKLKTADFEIITRSKTLSNYTDQLTLIENVAIQLFQQEVSHDLELPKLRLMGVRVADLKFVEIKNDQTILQYFQKRQSLSIASNENATSQIIDENVASQIIDENEDVIEDDDDDVDDVQLDATTIYIDNEIVEVRDEDESISTTINCPVCQKVLWGDNEKLNKHIDLCLNGTIVQTTIKEQNEQHHQEKAASKSNKRYRSPSGKTKSSVKKSLKTTTSPLSTGRKNLTLAISDYFPTIETKK